MSDQGTQSDADEMLPPTKRPVVESKPLFTISIMCQNLPLPPARSWSYDNLMTYPVMQPTMKKEKRIQKQVVDGEERDVEVEVEMPPPFKQLFLFSGKEASL
jgi:hypothetical protein